MPLRCQPCEKCDVSSSKSEAHDTLRVRLAEEDRAATQSAICTENLMECGRAISQTSSPTDRQTERQTDGLIAILRRFLVGGGVIAKFHYTDPTRTRPDPHGPARTFIAAKLRWVRAGPVGFV